MITLIELLAKSILWGITSAMTLAAVIVTAHRKRWRLGKFTVLLFMNVLLLCITQVLFSCIMENLNLLFPPDGSRNENDLMLLMANFLVWPICISFIYSIIKAVRKAAISWVHTNDVRSAYSIFGTDLGESILLFLSYLKEGARRVRDLDFFSIEAIEEEPEKEPEDESENTEARYGRS